MVGKEGFNLKLSSLFVGIDGGAGTVGLRVDFHFDFIADTPAGTEHVMGAGVDTIVKALPFEGQVSRQGEVELFRTVKYFSASRYMNRMTGF